MVASARCTSQSTAAFSSGRTPSGRRSDGARRHRLLGPPAPAESGHPGGPVEVQRHGQRVVGPPRRPCRLGAGRLGIRPPALLLGQGLPPPPPFLAGGIALGPGFLPGGAQALHLGLQAGVGPGRRRLPGLARRPLLGQRRLGLLAGPAAGLLLGPRPPLPLLGRRLGRRQAPGQVVPAPRASSPAAPAARAISRDTHPGGRCSSSADAWSGPAALASASGQASRAFSRSQS